MISDSIQESILQSGHTYFELLPEQGPQKQKEAE